MNSANKEEFIKLARMNMKRAFFSALGIVGNYDDAADITQEAFIRAYKSFETYDNSRNFFTWFYKILKNLSLNKIRDSKIGKKTSLLDVREEDLSYDEGLSVEKEEEKRVLEKALMKLNADEREIIILREFEGYSYLEIAELLEIPKGSVMSKLYYSRKKLANIFLEYYE